MVMKILAVMGSPRLGSSYDIIKSFEDRITSKGNVDFDYLFLKDVRLELCKGCNTCITKGEEFCPLKDDRDVILNKMKLADAVIFVSPVYFFQVTALMKNLLDRFAYLGHRPVFFHKIAMGIAVCNVTGLKDTLKTLSMTTGFGFRFVAKLGVTIHPSLELSEKYKRKIDKRIDAAADKLYRAVDLKKKHHRNFMLIFPFRCLKLNSIISKKHFIADYRYYQNKESYDDIKLTLPRKFLGYFIEKIVKFDMKRKYKISTRESIR